MRRRLWWGWGFEDAALPVEPLRSVVTDLLGFPAAEPEQPVALESIRLPAPRLAVPERLWPLCSTHSRDRVLASSGQAYRDVVRRFRGRLDHPTDVVARPRDESEVLAVLAWAADVDAAVVVLGGGSGVVGGVEPRIPARFAGAVTLDVSALDRVLDVDPVSHSARVQAGASGTLLERQLAAHGMSLRFYPQSFELSTVGGWLATRAAGHFATGDTRIDHLVESIRALSYAGTWCSRRVPASGAGPSPDALLLGSEGTLGVITETWLRVRPRPGCRASSSVWFDGFRAGTDAVADLARSGLGPSNLRLIDADEAARSAGGDGRRSLLVLGFESVDEPVGDRMRAALRRVAKTGGEADEPRIDDGPSAGASGSAASESEWRSSFVAMPYLRDALLQLGVVAETFESAITWDRFEAFHSEVTGAVREALGAPCHVSCRLTHAYPDGAAPYFTVLAPARRGAEVEQWDRIKAVATERGPTGRRRGDTPPRRRARPPTRLRPAAPGAVRRGTSRGQGRGGPRRPVQPGRAGRHLTGMADQGPRRRSHQTDTVVSVHVTASTMPAGSSPTVALRPATRTSSGSSRAYSTRTSCPTSRADG